LTELRLQIEEEKTARSRLFTELENLKARAEADGTTDGISERVANMNRAVLAADGRIAAMETDYGRLAYAEQMAERGNVEHGTPPDRTARRPSTNPERDAALQAIDRNAGHFLDDGSAERVEAAARKPEPSNVTARYLAAVADENYRTAFLKL